MDQKYIIIIFLLILLLISIYLTYKKKETFVEPPDAGVFYSGFKDEMVGVCKTDSNEYPILRNSFYKSQDNNLNEYSKNLEKLHIYSNSSYNSKLDCLKKCRVVPNYSACEMITTEEEDLHCYSHMDDGVYDKQKTISHIQSMDNTFYLKWLWNNSSEFINEDYEFYENKYYELDSGINLPNCEEKIGRDVIIFIAFTKEENKNILTPRNTELNKLLSDHDKFLFSGESKLMRNIGDRENTDWKEVDFVDQDSIKLYLGKIVEFKHNEDLITGDSDPAATPPVYQLKISYTDDNGFEKELSKKWPISDDENRVYYGNTKDPIDIKWFGVKLLNNDDSKFILNNKQNVCYLKTDPSSPIMDQIKLVDDKPIYSVGDIVIVDGYKGIITTVHNGGEEYSVKIKSLRQRIRVPSNKVVHYQRHECYGMPDGHPCKDGSYCYNERKCQSLDKFKKVIIGAPHPSICSLGEVDDIWSSKYAGEVDKNNICNASVIKPWLLRKKSDEFTKIEKDALNKLYDYTEFIESRPGGVSKCKEGKKIMTKDECEEAANRTDGKKWGGVIRNKYKRPPGCFWTETGTYYFNEELDHLDWGENKKEYSKVGSVCKKQLCENEKFRNECPATCYGCSKNKNYFHNYSKENL